MQITGEDYFAHQRFAGQEIKEGVVLAESSPFLGDGVGRPYVVRLIVREHPYHPFVVWVYFLDEPFDRGYGNYLSNVREAARVYEAKCEKWQVIP